MVNKLEIVWQHGIKESPYYGEINENKSKPGKETKSTSLMGLQKSETDYVIIHYPLTNQIFKNH